MTDLTTALRVCSTVIRRQWSRSDHLVHRLVTMPESYHSRLLTANQGHCPLFRHEKSTLTTRYWYHVTSAKMRETLLFLVK